MMEPFRMEQGTTERVSLIFRGPKKMLIGKKTHVFEGHVIPCFDGYCCEKLNQRPRFRVGAVLLKYEVEPTGETLYINRRDPEMDNIPETGDPFQGVQLVRPLQFTIVPYTMGELMYSNIHKAMDGPVLCDLDLFCHNGDYQSISVRKVNEKAAWKKLGDKKRKGILSEFDKVMEELPDMLCPEYDTDKLKKWLDGGEPPWTDVGPGESRYAILKESAA